MKKLLTLALILLTGLNALASGRWHELKTGAFTSLEVINDINVVCRFNPDSVGTARFFCDERLADAVIFDRSKPTKLKIMLSPDFIEKSDEVPLVYVYTDMLEHVESSSEKSVLVENPPKCPKLKTILIGNGHLEVNGIDTPRLIGVLATGGGTIALHGQTSDCLLKLTGAGSIQAHDLNADKVTCHVFMAGEIFCFPQNELVLKGLGSTRVYYRGTPGKIKKSGLGKLIPMEEGK